jgi:pyridoxamine 5'-phosphate oxidase family protein
VKDGFVESLPVDLLFNGDEDTIDVGGLNFGAGKKLRDVEENPKVAFLVDDVIGPPRRARASRSEETRSSTRRRGDDQPTVPELRAAVHPDPPDAIVSWGIEGDATATSATAGEIDHNARDVG